jgi:hypothetical protein
VQLISAEKNICPGPHFKEPRMKLRTLLPALLLPGLLLAGCGPDGDPTSPVEQITATPPVETSTPAPAPVYLADLAPLAVQVGAFDLGVGIVPRSEGGSLAGDPLQSGGTRYPKGLYAHAPSLLAYSLEGKYASFHTSFFVHPGVDCGDGVQFAVYLDNRGSFTSLSYRSGQAGSLTLDVRGVQTIFLQAQAISSMDCDWAVWGDPYVTLDLPVDPVVFTPADDAPLIAIAADAPCAGSDAIGDYIFLDCEDVRRIRQELVAGNPDAILNFLALRESLRQFSFDFPEGAAPTREPFQPYLSTGHDYPPRQIALLFLISGDAAYAEQLRDLLEQAVRLPVSTRWADSSYGLIIPIETGGEVYQALLFAYASIRDTGLLTAEEQVYYEDFFLRHAQAMLRWSDFTDGVWNPGIRADATAAMFALYLPDDPRSAGIYQTARRSLYARIEAWFDQDGGYREYSDNYTPYVLESILLYAETEARLGNDIYAMDFGGKNIHEMCRWFLVELTPQGALPAMNDGGWDSIDPGLMQLCGQRYHDPELLFAYQRLHAGQPGSFSVPAYFHQLAWANSSLAPVTPAFTSAALPAGGLAVFRSGWSESDQYLLLEFTPSVHHQHYHSGSLVLHDGLPWLIDNGYPATTDEEYARGSSSMDHSTLTLDDRNHELTGGELTAFQDLGNSGYLSVDLHTYEYLDLSRTVFWVKPFHQWVVLDQADGQGTHTLTTRWYVQGEAGQLAPLSWEFRQGEAAFQVRLFPGIDMQDELIARHYLWGSEPAYGSSQGVAASAEVGEWPVQIATLLTSGTIEQAGSADLPGGRLITTSFAGGGESRVWLAFSGNAGASLDAENSLTGLAGCTLWQDDLLTGYSLYEGSTLIAEGNTLVGGTGPVSVDADFAAQTIVLGDAADGPLSLYWPGQVVSVVQEDGSPVPFEWQDMVLQIGVSGGGQTLQVNRP